MFQDPKPHQYPECRRCPFYLADKCLISPSRILLHFYCPASEGFQAEKVLPAIYAVAADSIPQGLWR